MTDKKNMAADLDSRLRRVKRTRWLRFGIVALIYTLWVAWLGNWWFALGLLLLFDIYITGYIPFTWWKQSKSKATRTLMSWVDAIVYALILVYFVFTFLGQNYMIPSSSLEKTLLTGDYLVVNKMIYGPRVPITPVHFPLVHNKMPIIGTDSYLDWPQNGYRRLKGLRSVEAGDIVVFNFPAGDTVATKYEETANYYDLVREYGWGAVNNNPQTFGEVKYRPVDRRTNYVKRAIGLPGQRLSIRRDTVYIDGNAQPLPKNAQFRYLFTTHGPITNAQAHKYGITASDIQSLHPDFSRQLAQYYYDIDASLPMYSAPLTADMIEQMRADGVIAQLIKANDIPGLAMADVFPAGAATGWTISDWGGDDGVLIPAKGLTVPLDSANWALYERCIRNYEGHSDAEFRDGQAYIDGKPAADYTFAMDYYFMMGDNRDNSLDSRFWGFVPEDHIVGTPMFVAVSFDHDRSLFDGGIRWSRIFSSSNPDKEAFKQSETL